MESEEDEVGRVSIKSRLRTRNKEVAGLFPLRETTETTQIPGTGEAPPQIQTRTMLGHVPFSSIDLHNWKAQSGSLSDDPSPIIKLMQSVVRTHKPTYEDIQQLMDHLLSDDEIDRVREQMYRELRERRRNQGDYDAIRDQWIPPAVPDWNPNTPDGRERLEVYRDLFLCGLRRAGQKHIDHGKVRDIIQGPKEPPGDFMKRLKEAYRQYTDTDPDDDRNRRLINQSFLQQCNKDIRKKKYKSKKVTWKWSPDY